MSGKLSAHVFEGYCGDPWTHACASCLSISPSIKGQGIWARNMKTKCLVEFPLSRTKKSFLLDSVGPGFIPVIVQWKV